MTNKHILMGTGAVFGLAIAAVMIVPASRRHALGTLLGEPMQNEKYMSEWVRQLHDPDDDKRNEAAANLGNIDERGRPALPELLRVVREEKDSKVRAAAAFAVYKISAEVRRHRAHATEIYDTVVAALEDPDALTRMNAALALGTLEGDARAAIPSLEKAIRKSENKGKVLTFPLTIREQMIADIGSMGEDGKDGLALLKEFLTDPEETTRKRCAVVLGQLGPAAKEKQVIDMLKEAIDDPAESETVQESAKEALRLIDPEEAKKLADN
jgi:HEAT repeat protein